MNSEKLGLDAVQKGLVAMIPIITAVIFYYLPSLAELIEMIPFLSDNQLINFITGIGGAWFNWGLAAVGLILGFFLSMYIYSEILKMEVNRDYVVVDVFDKKSEIKKSDIQSVYKEGKKLVIIDTDGYELVRQETDHPAAKLENAFRKFHYPWVGVDTYKGEFFEWTAGHEKLSDTANMMLYERRQAKRDDEGKKVKDLKDDLMELGIVVKDSDDSQLVRLVNH